MPLRVFFRSRGPQHSRWSRSCVSPGRKIRRKRRLSWAKSSSVIVLSSSFLAVRDENLMGNLNTYIHACMHACMPACLPAYLPTSLHTYITLHYITKRSSTKAVFWKKVLVGPMFAGDMQRTPMVVSDTHFPSWLGNVRSGIHGSQEIQQKDGQFGSGDPSLTLAPVSQPHVFQYLFIRCKTMTMKPFIQCSRAMVLSRLCGTMPFPYKYRFPSSNCDHLSLAQTLGSSPTETVHILGAFVQLGWWQSLQKKTEPAMGEGTQFKWACI